MKRSEPHRLQVMFDVHQFDLTQADRDQMADALDGLAKQAENFPVADLHILVEGNARTTDCSIKLTLRLPSNTLVANDHDAVPYAAFDRCLTSLTYALQAEKARLDQESKRQKTGKGTDHDVLATTTVDLGAIDDAVAAGDYAAFRRATLPFEDAIQMRAGRWVQRFPGYEARIGRDVKMSDVVEEVFLTAFDQFPKRSAGVPLGEWMEGRIDPAVKTLMTRTAEEMENINLVRAELAAAR
jgi:ribosome-associated translation inhibitor RaiA